MKTITLTLFLLLISVSTLSQVDYCVNATEEENQGRPYFAGIKASQCGVEFSVDEHAYDEIKYPRAINCFVRAAEYFAIAEGTRFGSNATRPKEEAIAEAKRLMVLCENTKDCSYPKSLKERLEKVIKGEDAKPKEEEIAEEKPIDKEEKPEPNEKPTTFNSRTIYLNGKAEVFSMELPEGIDLYYATVDNYKMPDKSEVGIPGLQTDHFRKLNLIAANKVRIKDPYFEIEFKVTKDSTLFGNKVESSFTVAGREKDESTDAFGLTKRSYGSYPGKMYINNTDSYNKRTDTQRTLSMDMRHKVMLDNGMTAYLFFKVRKNLYSREVFDKLFYMFKSFKPVGESAQKPCKDVEEKLLYNQAVKINFKLYDKHRRTTIIQKPTLERDRVPAAWAEISQSIITAINRKKTAFKGIGTIESLQNKEKLSAFVKQVSWLENLDILNIVGVEFIPAEVSVAPTGNASNLVSFYLNALRGSAEGINNLEDRLNNMGINLFWEVPYIGVEGRCIPKMICKDGELKPDYSGFVYEEVKRSKGEFRGDKMALTLTQLNAELENNFEKVQEDFLTEKEYKALTDPCYYCELSPYDITFPTEATPCDIEKYRVTLLDKQKKDTEISIKIHEELLRDWNRNKFKIKKDLDRQIKIQEKLIKENSDTIASLKKQIVIKENLVKNYEDNVRDYQNIPAYQKAKADIIIFKNEIVRLRGLNDQLRLDIVENDNAISRIDNDERGNFLRNEIKKFETERAKLKSKKDESMRIRDNKCKGKK